MGSSSGLGGGGGVPRSVSRHMLGKFNSGLRVYETTSECCGRCRWLAGWDVEPTVRLHNTTRSTGPHSGAPAFSSRLPQLLQPARSPAMFCFFFLSTSYPPLPGAGPGEGLEQGLAGSSCSSHPPASSPQRAAGWCGLVSAHRASSETPPRRCFKSAREHHGQWTCNHDHGNLGAKLCAW